VNYPFKFNNVNQTETSFPNENLQYSSVYYIVWLSPQKIKEPSNERLGF